MSRLFDLFKTTPMYAALLERVPEEEREAAIAALQRQIAPYEALVTSLPGNAFEKFVSSMGKGTQEAPPGVPPESTRRLPRRF